MKNTFLLSLVFCSFFANAQNKELKPFFIDKDKLIGGYKNSKGKIIIPAKYTLMNGDEMTTPDCQYVYVLASGISKKPVLHSEVCKVFNKQGKLLYNAYWFDNGPDYFKEGMRRYVENGKIGFVNILGLKEIKAQWDYASNFENGIAMVGNKCRSVKVEDEHANISCESYSIINYEGIIIAKADSTTNIDSIKKVNKERIVFSKPLLAQEVEYKLQNLPTVKQNIKNGDLEKESLLFYLKDNAQKRCWLFIFKGENDLFDTEIQYLYYPESKLLYQLNDCGNKTKINI